MEKNQEKSANPRYMTYAILTLIVGILFVLFAPIIMTRSWGYFSFITTGQIGDTIGGITAPITSLIGSILIFFALRAQIEANNIVQKQIQNQNVEELKKKTEQIIDAQIRMVQHEIDYFTFYKIAAVRVPINNEMSKMETQKFNFEGADAITEYIESLKELSGSTCTANVQDENPKLVTLTNLLFVINNLFNTIDKASIDVADKQYFASLLSYQFVAKVRPALNANEKHKASTTLPCDKCGESHIGIPDELFAIRDLISEKANDSIYKATPVLKEGGAI
jgi:hypothetical protein